MWVSTVPLHSIYTNSTRTRKELYVEQMVSFSYTVLSGIHLVQQQFLTIQGTIKESSFSDRKQKFPGQSSGVSLVETSKRGMGNLFFVLLSVLVLFHFVLQMHSNEKRVRRCFFKSLSKRILLRTVSEKEILYTEKAKSCQKCLVKNERQRIPNFN